MVSLLLFLFDMNRCPACDLESKIHVHVDPYASPVIMSVS